MQTKSTTAFFRLVLGVLSFSCLNTGGAIELQDISVYSDTSKSAIERIHILFSSLVEEVQTPTKARQGWGGGEINHDYVLTQLALGMWHVVKESSEAKDLLLKKLEQSHSSGVRDVLQLALGLAGDASGAKDLAVMLKKQDQPHRRALAASALGKCGDVLFIPDLVEALSDPYMESGGSFGVHGESFPVRRAASLSLRSLGVVVDIPSPPNEFDYNVDLNSAVKVIEPLLQDSNKEKVINAIQAIERLQGAAARDVLQRFVDQNQGVSDNEQLVSRARRALDGMVGAPSPFPDE